MSQTTKIDLLTEVISYGGLPLRRAEAFARLYIEQETGAA